MAASSPTRKDGYLQLSQYGALGDGRSVALSGADGSIDWWCVPQLDSPPLFDRLLDADEGGRFSITPHGEYTVQRNYREHSNVLETTFIAGKASARLTESLNSGLAGRQPWSELARRIEGISGSMRFDIVFRPGNRGKTATSWREDNRNGEIFHIGGVNAILRHNDGIRIIASDDREVRAELVTQKGSRATIAVLAAENRPLIASDIGDIDKRIDHSDNEWRDWANWLSYDGIYKNEVLRSALAMKLLLFSPSGAIAAAATTSLPEKLGGKKDYDYRYGWVRDAAYTIKAFLAVGALGEVQAAFAWMLDSIRRHGPEIHPFYRLDGSYPEEARIIPLPGYRASGHVMRGNPASSQYQLGLYGDVLETAWLFVRHGHLLDMATRRLLAELVDRCADEWQQKDSGLWELEEQQHYTNSKVNCWVALSRAVMMAEAGHLDATHAARWAREKDRIGAWIDEHCWCEAKQAYTMYAGCDKLDASIILGVRFGFDRKERLQSTLEAIVRELGRDALIYRYSGMEYKEGTFIACAYWVAEAYALLGNRDEAIRRMDALKALLDVNLGLLNEMFDPATHEMLGNMPQCLSHLAMIRAAVSINEAGSR